VTFFNRRRRIAILLVVFVTLGLLAGILLNSSHDGKSQSSGQVALVTPPTGAGATSTTGDPGNLAQGRAIYTAQCLACHGAAGKGDGPAAAGLNPAPVDFTSPIHRGHRREDQIAWVTNGLPPSAMPAFGGKLAPADIEAVVDYVRSLGAAAAADGSLDTPGGALCTVEPADPASLRTAPLDAPAPAPTPAAIVGAEFQWPQGEPASRDEIDGVTSALRLFVACGNAGDQKRRLALYSKRFIAPQFDAMGAEDWQRLLAFADGNPAPLAVAEQIGILALREFQQLPDGRVGVYASTVDPVNHPHETDAVVIFVKQGDRWLIDEIHGDPNGVLLATPLPSPTAASAPAPGPETPEPRGGLTFILTESPAQPGPGSFVLRITDAQGNPVNDATVTVEVDMADMPMGVTTGTATALGAGSYSFRSSFAMAGNWHIQGQAQRASGDSIAFAFDIKIPAP
jgi:mono/diheme cytochrome c family protein